MARQLWLLRHADAEPHGTRTDSERMLTSRGELQARVAGAALRQLDPVFDSVLVSPKVRARRTADIACEQWEREQRKLQLHPPLAAGFDARQALQALEETGNDSHILLVGHEPDLSTIITELTGARADLKKGGLAALRLQGAGGELFILLRPRELALIAHEGDLDV